MAASRYEVPKMKQILYSHLFFSIFFIMLLQIYQNVGPKHKMCCKLNHLAYFYQRIK